MKRPLMFLASAVFLALVLMAFAFGLPGSFPGSHASTGEELPTSFSFVGASQVEEKMEEERRGPVRDILVTGHGVLAVLDDEIALFGTDPVSEVWSLRELDSPVAAGVSADGEQIVLAQGGQGLFSSRTHWAVLDEATGRVVAEHRAEETPDELVALLTSEARLTLEGNGQVTAHALEDDREMWFREPVDTCEESEVRVVGSTIVIASVCGEEVRLAGLVAETGQTEWEHSWPGSVLPELYPLTSRTIPGGPADPVERIVRGDLADGYVLFGRGSVFDQGQAQEFLPPQSAPSESPAHVVLLEDLQDAEARLMLQAGHVMVEDGLVALEELDREGLLVDGELPMSTREWGGDPRILLGALQAVLSDAVSET